MTSRHSVAARLPRVDRVALGSFLTNVYSRALLASDSLMEARALVARIRHARGTRWFALTPLTPFGDAPAGVILSVGGRAWARELSYAPDSHLARLQVPILAISSAADQDVPAKPNLAGIRDGMRAVARGQLATILLAGASHALLMPRRRGAEDTFVPAFFLTIGGWLDRYRRLPRD